jgi:FMN-dependent NADH-azoreductase
MDRTILRVDSGADHAGSVTRQLADVLLAHLANPSDRVVRRSATEGLPLVSGSWVEAAFANGDRSELALSDVLIDELLAADELVLVAPVYNFGIPAALKAWVDQVLRAGRTFRFDQNGSVGLATAQRAWIVTASGSTRVGSSLDFNTPYLRAVLGFIGIADVRVIAADAHLVDHDAVKRGFDAAAAA